MQLEVQFIFLVFMLCSEPLLYETTPTLKLLGQFNRLRGEHTDVYFSCEVGSNTLIWNYDGNELHRFEMVGRYTASLKMRNDFNFTASLLSSKAIVNDGREIMYSILVLMFVGTPPSSFKISCSDDYNTTREEGSLSNYSLVLASNGSVDHILLDYVLMSDIVDGIITYVWVCQVDDNVQVVETGNLITGFNADDKVSSVRNLFSTNQGIINMQSILISRNDNKTTSLNFISTNNIDIRVSCGKFNNTDPVTLYTTMTVSSVIPITTRFAADINSTQTMDVFNQNSTNGQPAITTGNNEKPQGPTSSSTNYTIYIILILTGVAIILLGGFLFSLWSFWKIKHDIGLSANEDRQRSDICTIIQFGIHCILQLNISAIFWNNQQGIPPNV